MCPGDTGITRRVVVGVVIKPVGLKGELKIKPLTDNPDRYVPGGKIWLSPPEGGTAPFIIKAISEHKGNLKLLLGGIGSVEEAVFYRGQEVFVPEDEVPELPDGEYYHYQINGLEVYTHGGRLLGRVEDILPAGEKDVYVVRGAGREYLIPVNEGTVKDIDVKGGRITLYPMEGYIPEDEV